MSDEASTENHNHRSFPVEVETTASTGGDAETSNDLAAGDGSSSAGSQPSSLAKGLSSLIGSLIKDFDAQAESTIRSQDHLTSNLDRLTRELDQLLEDAPSPFIMQHAAKISGVRKRVSSLNSVLKSIQRRVDNIDRMLSAGLPNDKTASGSGAQQ